MKLIFSKQRIRNRFIHCEAAFRKRMTKDAGDICGTPICLVSDSTQLNLNSDELGVHNYLYSWIIDRSLKCKSPVISMLLTHTDKKNLKLYNACPSQGNSFILYNLTLCHYIFYAHSDSKSIMIEHILQH